MPLPAPNHPILRAAARWRDRCLRKDGSVFTEKSLWTSENVRYLVRYYADNLEEGEESFLEKLEKQLAPAPGSAKQLAAEMLWVMYLIAVPGSMQPGLKRHQIRQVWGWSGEPIPDAPTELEAALNDGVVHPGPAYNVLRWREFLFFVTAMEVWKSLSKAEQESRLADPWRFGRWLTDQDESGTRQLRHILLYLLFPNHYEPVVTGDQKRRIVRAFARKTGKDSRLVDYRDKMALDQNLSRIREGLQREGASESFSFHEEPHVREWRSGTGPRNENETPSPVDDDRWYAERFGEARVWLLAPGPGASLWDEFQRESIIAIGWDELGDLREYPTRDAIHEKLRDLYGSRNPRNDSLACYQFANKMRREDHVVVKQGRKLLLGRGVVKHGYDFDESRARFRHIRRVRWDNVGRWPIPKERSGITTKTLTDFSPHKNWLRMAYGVMEGSGTHVVKPPGPPEPPYPIEDALQDLFMAPGEFRTIIDALERKMNIVLEGPPGVGKTFIAKRLAYRLIGYKVPERVRMIQFHQSYAYEDFIQGYRPNADGRFDLTPGVFYTFCQKAAKNTDKRYVFIIDEVNRGNLSKIFGELMMLIEADKRGREYAIPLTYSPDEEPFHVPDNLYLIGMMNTADRSLAMVDYALRRRFAFHRLQPAFETDQFSNFLLEAGVEEDLVGRIVERLTRLNHKIRTDRKNLGPGFEIGHSFFCPRDDDEQLDDSWYETIIRREIAPLLREYWFDRPDDEVEAVIGDLLA